MRRRTLAGLVAGATLAILVASASLFMDTPRPPRIPEAFSVGSPSNREMVPTSTPPQSLSPLAPGHSDVLPGAPAERASPKPSRPEEYLLHVVDPTTKHPVVGANVLATPNGNGLDPDAPPLPVSGTTDADGYVRLALDPLAGGYLIRVTGEGRATVEQELQPGAGGRFAVGELPLSPAGSIAGRVLDADGKPVAAATVYVDGTTGIFHLDKAHVGGRLGVFPDVPTLSAKLKSTATAADGTFRIDGVPVGQVLMVFSAATSGSPSSADPEFRIAPEETIARPDLRLTAESSVAVRFLDGTGNGSSESIQAWISTRLGYVPLVPTSLGILEASRLDPGFQLLLFVPERSAFGAVPITIQEGQRCLKDVTLSDGSPMSGIVERSGGIPVPGITVEARGSIPGVVAALPVRAAVSDSEGRFTIAGLPVKGTIFAVRGPETGLLYEQGDIAQSSLHLQVPASVRAVLQPTDKRPFPPKAIVRAWAGPTERDVHLQPLDQPGNVSLDFKTGEFRVRELPAGACTLRISVSGFALISKDLDLPSGETTDMGTLVLSPGFPIEGTVLAPDGRGQPGIRVCAWFPNGESVATYTGPDGRFAFRCLRPGPATLEFHDAVSRETRFALDVRAVNVEAGTPPVRVELQEGGMVEVSVQRRDGRAPTCTVVGCDPGGVPYRPEPEPFVPKNTNVYRGRRILGATEVTLYDGRGNLVARSPVTVQRGKLATVVLYER